MEVTAWVEGGDGRTGAATRGFWCHGFVGSSVVPQFIQAGFGALRECPQCPNCNSGMDKFFKAAGANSFAEVEEKWIKPIREDFERTCPNHNSDHVTNL